MLRRVRHPVIIVEGNIGVGKSTFVREALEYLGPNAELFMEPVDDEINATPYLDDFYKDMLRWGFTQQVDFLVRRFDIQLKAQIHAKVFGPSIVDRSFYGDTCFYWKLLKDGLASQREFDTYENLYEAMTRFVLLPTACVHLRIAPKRVLERIYKRGRGCEQGITLDYLTGLDHEINSMVEVLRQQGVYIEPIAWDMDRATKADRAPEVESVMHRILAYKGPDLFTEKHRRIS